MRAQPDPAPEQNKILTVPNALSVLRILLVPVFVYVILQRRPLEGMVVFFIASATDGLDGFIARAFRQKSKLGRFLDPAGDKLLMVTSYIILSIRSLGFANAIPFWLTFFVVGRDILIVLGAFFLFRYADGDKIRVNLIGKLNTICQMSVLLLVLILNWLEKSSGLLVFLYALTLFLTVLSGVSYTVSAVRLFKKRKAR